MKRNSNDPERRRAPRLQALRSMVRKLSPFYVLVVAFGLGALLDACDQHANASERPSKSFVHVMAPVPKLPPAVRKQIGGSAR
jgi:hypothetical protein